jgi:putative transposase
MNKAFKYRIYPKKNQEEFLTKQFGCARFVYNNTVAYRKEIYNKEKKHISKFNLIKRLVPLKKEFPWLSEVDSQVLQQAVGNADRSHGNFLAHRAGYPQFKNKHSKQSIHYPQRVKINQESKKICLPKVGLVEIVLHRPFEGTMKGVTVSKTKTGKYYASVLCEIEDKKLVVQHIDKVIGLDLGLHDLMVSSDGLMTGNPKFIKRASANLARKQKNLARKKKGSKRSNNARLLVAKAHEKVAACRSDFQHKWSKRLVDENQAIIVEDLNIKGMVKNRKLSKAISDASWHSLITKLAYKLDWQGKHLVKIDRFYASTQICNSCGRKQKLELNQREYSCICGWSQPRDINAALNIKDQGIEKLKAAGYSVSARGGYVRLPLRGLPPKEAMANEARSSFL